MNMKSRSRKIVHTSKLFTMRSLERRKIIERLGCKCHWCGVFTDNSVYGEGTPRETTIDHLYNKLDPRRKGNSDKVVIACESCNQMRARIAEFVFGRQFPIRHAAKVDEIRIEQIVVDVIPQSEHQSALPVEDTEQKVIANAPAIKGPRVVRYEPLTLWERFSIWAKAKYRKWFK